MNKAHIWISMAVILALALGSMLVGCASKEETVTPAAPAETTKAPTKVYTYTVGGAFTSDHFLWKVYNPMMDEITKRSGSRIKFDFRGGPELIPAGDLLRACGGGAIDSFMSVAAYYTGAVPESEIYSLPIVEWTYENSYDLGKRITPDLYRVYRDRANTQPISKNFQFNNFVTAKKPVTKLEDMKGLKLRSVGGYFTDLIKEMGAAPVTISATEVYQALQLGTIDGGIRAAWLMRFYKEHEVSKYITAEGFPVGGAWMWINKDKFDSLPADLQKIVMTVGDEWEPIGTRMVREEDTKETEEIKKLGMQLVHVAPGDMPAWLAAQKSAATKYWDRFMGPAGKTWIDKLKGS